MKIIISILVGIATFIGVFILAGLFIAWVTSGVDDNDTKQILKVILWICSFGFTFWISIILGYITGKVISILLGVKDY